MNDISKERKESYERRNRRSKNESIPLIYQKGKMSLVNQYILDDKRVMGKNISKARNESKYPIYRHNRNES